MLSTVAHALFGTALDTSIAAGYVLADNRDEILALAAASAAENLPSSRG